LLKEHHCQRGPHTLLPEPVYRLAVGTFGQHGADELFYLVGVCALVSVTLNAFDVRVPERP
jgi:4-carboxymuconolactone decarboxylase